MTFYANETTSPLHGRLCRDGEETHPQYLNNPETFTSIVESEHDKINTLICRPSEFLSAWASAESDQSASVRRKWIFGKPLSAQRNMLGSVTLLDASSDWGSGVRGFDPRIGHSLPYTDSRRA